MNDVSKVFKTDIEIKNHYDSFLNLGVTMDAPIISEQVYSLKNKNKISLNIIPPVPGSTISQLVFKRKIGWFKNQKISLKIENDYDKYNKGYQQVENIFKNFLIFYRNYESKLGITEDNIYHKTFVTINLDNVPSLMFYIHNLFTHDVTHWIRFKRLFAVIQGCVDPIIISTIKFKYIEYLLQQNRILILEEQSDNQYIRTTTDPILLHKLMDMLIYLPYNYLFFMFKVMDVNNTLLPTLNLLSE